MLLRMCLVLVFLGLGNAGFADSASLQDKSRIERLMELPSEKTVSELGKIEVDNDRPRDPDTDNWSRLIITLSADVSLQEVLSLIERHKMKVVTTMPFFAQIVVDVPLDNFIFIESRNCSRQQEIRVFRCIDIEIAKFLAEQEEIVVVAAPDSKLVRM